MIRNYHREVISIGSRMGCYVGLTEVYFEVACDIVHLNLCRSYVELVFKNDYDIHFIFMVLYIIIMSIFD